MVQMCPHCADVLQRSTAERTPITVLTMMIPDHLLLPEVWLVALILGRRGDRSAGSSGGNLLLVILRHRLTMMMVMRGRRNG